MSCLRPNIAFSTGDLGIVDSVPPVVIGQSHLCSLLLTKVLIPGAILTRIHSCGCATRRFYALSTYLVRIGQYTHCMA